MAFSLRGETQVSSYSKLTVRYSNTSTTEEGFKKIEGVGDTANIMRFALEKSCGISMQKFEFCEDGSCQVTQLTPFGKVYPNR